MTGSGETRRSFCSLGAAVALAPGASSSQAPAFPSKRISLNGEWQFRIDAQGKWRTVNVPHTWQVEPDLTEYMGRATYTRTVLIKPEWLSGCIRIEFEAVFHSARIFLNNKPVGQHLGKGYTAFIVDVTGAASVGPNELRVEVDNAFQDGMLPRLRSSDWAHDGGIYRPVNLLVTPAAFIERLEIRAVPNPGSDTAVVNAAIVVTNSGKTAWKGEILPAVVDDASGLETTRGTSQTVSLPPGSTQTFHLPPLNVAKAKLWHFDHPNLYRLEVALSAGGAAAPHTTSDIFGIRTIEARSDGFYLNGERIRPMGVERMAGSHPDYGMAEPAEWIRHDHDDMKALNCVFTRVHWQQDRRVLDYCDRHGMLIQIEVPGWGPDTFKDQAGNPSTALLSNGLEQLREMIARERNHPCVFAWGVCNETNGQHPAAFKFSEELYKEAKRLDPARLVTYASHSLFTNPERDVSRMMDFIEWNQYFGSWQKGGVQELRATLDQLKKAIPGKLIVISEYGYCACTAERREGDAERIQVLQSQTQLLREDPRIAGLIFFCYNDYRTHIGDKGTGALRQRVHGVVDVYGNRKPSYEFLRRESSPVASVTLSKKGEEWEARVETRKQMPAYTLKGYKLSAVAWGQGNIPLERTQVPLLDLKPGSATSTGLSFKTKGIQRVTVDVVRPTGFSVWTETWQS